MPTILAVPKRILLYLASPALAPIAAALITALRWVEARSEARGRGDGGAGSGASARRAPMWMTVVVVVVALVTSAAADYETYLVGHSGAASVWSGIDTETGAGQPASESEGKE